MVELTRVQRQDSIDYVPAGAISAGDLIDVGAFTAVAFDDIAASATGAVCPEGVYDCLKEATTDTYAVGDLVYWDEGNSYATKTPTDRFLGVAVLAATATAATVRIALAPPGVAPQHYVSEEFSVGDFTDGTGASGYVDCAAANQIPAMSHVLGWVAVVTVGFTGDTTAVCAVGISGDTNLFSVVSTTSVLAAATVGCFPTAADASALRTAATTWRVTVTGGADFTSISAGTMTVYVFYKPVGVPI